MKPTIFQFDSAVVRTFADDKGEPWFCATDVCEVLGYANGPQAIQKNCRTPGVSNRDIGVVTGKKADGSDAVQHVKMTFINEGNLYRLIIKSRKPEAARFEAWVCDEVLPTIRKTGGYAQPQAAATVNGQISVELAEYVALLKQQAELAKLKAQSEQTQSKIAIATALMQSGTYSREEIAEIAGIDLHTVDYLFADLCREAAKRGAISFRMRNH